MLVVNALSGGFPPQWEGSEIVKQKIYVYVLNKDGKPLMPTTRLGKVRRLLKSGLAKPVCNKPFTIKLKYETPDIIQSLTLGIDTGRENIGEGVSDEDGNCLFLCNTETKNKAIKKAMSERKQHRNERRHHKRQKKQRNALRNHSQIQKGDDNILRSKKDCKSINVSYPGMDEFITHKVIKGKEAKFNNRVRSENWLTPSAIQLIQIYFNCIKQTMAILPISQINIERVCFDFQKLENQNIYSWEYSKGILYGFKDYKDYINSEQNGKCLICGKPIEHYHHIVPQHSNGSDTPKNIAGLCVHCHAEVHKNLVTQEQLSELKEGLKKQYEISLLNSVMPTLLEELDIFCKENNIVLKITDGYTTKQTRERLQLNKEHCYDGYCVSVFDKSVSRLNNLPDTIYKRRRFKKKSNNNIKKLNFRVYKLDGKIVAINRHKAMEQKSNSLEEYMIEYGKTHSDLECRQHIHQLEIYPAKRTYTFHKKGEVRYFKAGDKVLYNKVIKGLTKQFVLLVNGVKENRLIYQNSNGKETEVRPKYCKKLEGCSLSYIS